MKDTGFNINKETLHLTPIVIRRTCSVFVTAGSPLCCLAPSATGGFLFPVPWNDSHRNLANLTLLGALEKLLVGDKFSLGSPDVGELLTMLCW